MSYHGIAHTHLDSLAHINENGVFYNGYKPDAEAVRQGRPHEELDSQRQERHLHARHPDRHPAAEGRAVSRTGDADLRRGSRGVGKAGGRECRPPAMRCSSAPACGRAARPVGPWLRGRAEGGRSAGLDPSVIPWLKQRDIALLGSDHPQYVSPGTSGPPRGAVHDFALRLSRRAPVRQLRSRSAGGCGRVAQALGVPADRCAAADSRRHRLAAQSDRDLLATRITKT